MHEEVRLYNQSLSESRRAICDKLYVLINSRLTTADHKMWHGSPVWFLNGNPIVGYSSQKQHVRLLFWSGQSFETPGLLPEGKFRAAAADYVEVSQIDDSLVLRWLSEAENIQWDYKNIVKNKGKLTRLS